MTGYGKSGANYNNKTINVEIRTLNSKQADISIKMPNIYREFEIELNNLIKDKLLRGKIDCYISISYTKGEAQLDINEDLFQSYYKQLHNMCNEINADESYLTQYILQRDDVNSPALQAISKEEKEALFDAVNQTINIVNEYREQEGEALEKAFVKHIDKIEDLSLQVEPFEKNRVARIKEKLLQRFKELELTNVDENRLEQELIFYLEKLDITEERVRLKQHINYFRNTMQENISIGKKIGFIAQEMGREINTLGSKSNEANMQQIVVMMKDELEKIKEQSANVL